MKDENKNEGQEEGTGPGLYSTEKKKELDH